MDTSKYIFENFISDVSLNEYDHKQRLINYKNNNTKSNISKAVFESIINSIYNDKDGIEKNISDLNLTVLNDGLNAENIGLLVGNLLLKTFLNKVLDKFESIQDDLNDIAEKILATGGGNEQFFDPSKPPPFFDAMNAIENLEEMDDVSIGVAINYKSALS